MRNYVYLIHAIKEYTAGDGSLGHASRRGGKSKDKLDYKPIFTKEFWNFVDKHADKIDILLGYNNHEWADFMDMMDQIHYESSLDNPNISDEEYMEADKKLEKVLDDLDIYSYRENNEYQTLHYDSKELVKAIIYMFPFYGSSTHGFSKDFKILLDYYKHGV